jgi:hypothetical protein
MRSMPSKAKYLTSILFFSMAVGFADESMIAQSEIPDAEEEPIRPPKSNEQTRADSLPFESAEMANDHYLEGYIQALIDMHYYEFKVLVVVKDHNVYLSNLPKNEQLSNSITSFVKDIPGVKSVEVKGELSLEELEKRQMYVEQPRVEGVWFPQSTVLYPPMIADPRQPMYSAALRLGDHVVGRIAAAVSLGDDFPIFRWNDVFRWHGAMQIDIQAGIWSVFNFYHVPPDPCDGNCELVNTDYLLGIPLSYAVDRWAFRLRIYHLSSHLGDEFLINHLEYIKKRVNPSYEAIDFFTSYQFSGGLRGYFGPGIILHSDKCFPMKTFYLEYGLEWRFWGKKLYYHRLYGTPFIAIDIQNWQVRHWNFDKTIKIGYEISKLQGVGRKMRLYVDYHNGYSYEGQFFKEKTMYGEIGLSWGF